METETEIKNAIDKEELELIMWHINLFDSRRNSLENRAGITVSVSSVLFGGFLFLLGRVLDNVFQYPLTGHMILIVSSGLAMILLAGAIITATLAIANVHRTSKKLFGAKMPERIFFYPRATFERYPDCSSYKDGFNKLTTEQMKDNMLGELWVLTHEYHNRYQNLRRAIRLLTLSIVPILVATIVLFSKYI